MDSKKASLLAWAGGIVVVLAFALLPYLHMTVLGITVSGTGYQLATGTISGAEGMSAAESGLQASSDFWFFVVAAGISILISAFGAKIMDAKKAGIAHLVAGLVILGVWVVDILQVNSNLAKYNEQIDSYGSYFGMSKISLFSVIGIGYWLTAVGGILLVLAGVFMMKSGGAEVNYPQNPQNPVVPPAPPAA